MAYFYSTKYHIFPCFVHGEIRCAIAGDQVMGMRQYISITVQLMQTLFQMRGMRQVYTRFPVRQIVQRRQSDTLNNGTL